MHNESMGRRDPHEIKLQWHVHLYTPKSDYVWLTSSNSKSKKQKQWVQQIANNANASCLYQTLYKKITGR